MEKKLENQAGTKNLPAGLDNLEEHLSSEDFSDLKNQLSRRDLFKKSGKVLLASGISLFFLKKDLLASDKNNLKEMAIGYKNAEANLKERAKGYVSTDHYYVYIVNPKKCIGCAKCVSACKYENNVPDPYFRTWIERYTYHKHDEVSVDSPNGGLDGFPPAKDEKKVFKAFFFPKLCNQCEHPVCVQVCPVGATYTTEDGVVLVDNKHCVGCGYCIQSCPYGARFKNPKTHTADKCTWCYHRLSRGLSTACVTACPTGTRTIIDTKQTDDEEKFKYFSRSNLSVLKPELGTKPKVYYTELDKEIR